VHLNPKVGLSADFLQNVSGLPPAVQAKVWRWAVKFQHDPAAPGINYETIKRARDANLRSVRIDQDYRGIVLKPPAGDVYLLLHVNKHDAAYRWAEQHRLSVNPVTGALQVVNLEFVVAAEPAVDAPVAAPELSLYAAQTDAQLLSLGVPAELISAVRAITDEAGLDRLQPALPVEAYEGLFLLLTGDTVSEILQARETRVDRVIDTSDFGASLETAESQSRFVVVTSDEALQALLGAPLIQWRVFLHPTQRKLATGDRNGPMRVLGGAGTGKTVLAMHRAKWLAEQGAHDGRKVLITTFTKNLAIDIEENLRHLCDAAAFKRIEVTNLDALVHRFLRRQNYPHQIIYQRDNDAWHTALGQQDSSLELDDHFYREEWERVVLAQGVVDRDGYRAATRVGRGTVLSRQKRDAVWPVFEEYRTLLSARRLKHVEDAYRDAVALLAQGDIPVAYSSVVVDETQDLGPQALRLLRALVPVGKNDLFLVGDGHQRIYGRNQASLGKCGIDIRGRGKKLYINYRTTDEIRRRAVAILESVGADDLDGGTDDNSRYRSLTHGPAPEGRKCATVEEAIKSLAAPLDQWKQANETGAPFSLCVMTATQQIRDAIRSAVADRGAPTEIIESESRDLATGKAVRFATLHRAKGLEFDRVVVIAPASVLGDEGEADIKRQVYVGLTRAKQVATLLLL